LSDVCEPALVIVCEPCERRVRYKVERLMAEHGDAKLTDLLTIRIPSSVSEGAGLKARDDYVLMARMARAPAMRLALSDTRPSTPLSMRRL
jgi:hypothetical protein